MTEVGARRPQSLWLGKRYSPTLESLMNDWEWRRRNVYFGTRSHVEDRCNGVYLGGAMLQCPKGVKQRGESGHCGRSVP